MSDRAETLTVAEVCATLADFGALRCSGEVAIAEDDDGVGAVTLTVRVVPESQDYSGGAMMSLELFNRLRYLADVGQMRALATRYGIEPAALEALLPRVDA